MTQIGELFWFSQITWHDITLIHINTLYKYPLVIKRGNEISPAIYEQLSNGQKKEFSVPMLGDGHQSIDNFFGHFFKDSNYGIDDHTPYNPYMYHVLTIAYISLHIHIYIYTRNSWVLPRRCSVEVSHSQTHADATSQNSFGKNNKGTKEY